MVAIYEEALTLNKQCKKMDSELTKWLEKHMQDTDSEVDPKELLSNAEVAGELIEAQKLLFKKLRTMESIVKKASDS